MEREEELRDGWLPPRKFDESSGLARVEVMLDGDNTRKRGGSRVSMAESSPTSRDDGETVEGREGRTRRPLLSILAIDPLLPKSTLQDRSQNDFPDPSQHAGAWARPDEDDADAATGATATPTPEEGFVKTLSR